jgi:hypothetical protein
VIAQRIDATGGPVLQSNSMPGEIATYILGDRPEVTVASGERDLATKAEGCWE